MNNRFVASTPPEETERPQRPTPADVELLEFARELEFAARDLYRTALDGGSLGDDASKVLAVIHDTHGAAGNNLSGLLGVQAPPVESSSIYDDRAEAFGGSESDVLAAAYELESEIVATHADLIGRVESTDGVSTIVPVMLGEARHLPTIAALDGAAEDLGAMLDNDASSLAQGAGDTETVSTEPVSSEG